MGCLSLILSNETPAKSLSGGPQTPRIPFFQHGVLWGVFACGLRWLGRLGPLGYGPVGRHPPGPLPDADADATGCAAAGTNPAGNRPHAAVPTAACAGAARAGAIPAGRPDCATGAAG